MGADLVQNQIHHVVVEVNALHTKIDLMLSDLGEIKPELAVVLSQTADLRKELHNGLASRIARIEYAVIFGAAVIGLEKGPALIAKLVSFTSLLR